MKTFWLKASNASSFAIFLSLFLWQIYSQVYSFFLQETVTSLKLVKTETFQFPSISICFGFNQSKFDAVASYNESVRYYNFYPEAKEPIDPEDLKKWWNDITVSPKDVIEKIQFNEMTYTLLDSNTGLLSITEMDFTQGKCLTVKVKRPVAPSDRLVIIPKASNSLQKLMIYLHNDGQQIGVNGNNWPIKPTVVESPLDKFMQIFVTQKNMTLIKTVGNRCAADENYSLADCIQKKIRNLYSNVTNMHAKLPACKSQAFCAMPEYSQFLNNSTPFCTTKMATMCNVKFFEEHVAPLQVDYDDNLGCVGPCTLMAWEAQKVEYLVMHENYGRGFYFYLQNGLIQLEREYLLYTFPGIVSAVGGSLGLFLGFSCLTFFNSVARKALA